MFNNQHTMNVSVNIPMKTSRTADGILCQIPITGQQFIAKNMKDAESKAQIKIQNWLHENRAVQNIEA